MVPLESIKHMQDILFDIVDGRRQRIRLRTCIEIEICRNEIPGAVCCIKLDIGSTLPFQFVKISIDFFFRIAERFHLDRRCLYGMFVDHFFGFLYMERKIILHREIGNENFGLHLRIGDIIPAGILSLIYLCKIRILETETAG